MFDWMKEDGAQFDKLKVRNYSHNNRGVEATSNISQGETILFVPKT